MLIIYKSGIGIHPWCLVGYPSFVYFCMIMIVLSLNVAAYRFIAMSNGILHLGDFKNNYSFSAYHKISGGDNHIYNDS